MSNFDENLLSSAGAAMGGDGSSKSHDGKGGEVESPALPTREQPRQSRRARHSIAPLHTVVRTHVSTWEASVYLCREQQTLRVWACKENGPLRPIRVHGRLAWPVSRIRSVLGLEDGKGAGD